MTEKRGYILLTDTGTLFTKLIKQYTKKPYNHASIAIDSELSAVYSFGRKAARNPFIGGFVQEDTKSGLFKEATCAVYSFKISGEQLKKIEHYIQKMEAEQDQYCYNFLGLFGFIINKPIKRKNAFFCSEFVASVLKECSIIEFQRPPSLIAPNDFKEVTTLQLEFQGRLKDYHHDHPLPEETMRVPFPFIPVEM
ncbi:hypothetical protein [Lentibacillus sediminis]|uniref:hypothetical protein n=1 Tax=Lentibacillus sediminis TaxID=1940529 RepID=UPI000C1BB17F|nr:hypothetical protein [Lentibacillus sediminis]